MIELPKDAEGRDIPLDTKVLYDYDGSKQNVEVFIFSRKDAGWSVETDFAIYDAEELYLTPPDSWEKLLEDLDDFTGCCGRYAGYSALRIARATADRIRKLSGEDDAD